MKGKHANAARLRREDAEVRQDIHSYQQAIVRLQRERDEARAVLTNERKLIAAERRTLKAQLAEGTSSRVAALESVLASATSERDRARADLARIQDKWNRAIRRMQAHLIAEHGVKSSVEALEAVMRLLGSPDALIVDKNEQSLGRRNGAEAVKRVRRARSNGDVRGHALADLLARGD